MEFDPFSKPEIEARLAFIEETLTEYDMQMNYTPVYGQGSIQQAMEFLEDERELLEDQLQQQQQQEGSK